MSTTLKVCGTSCSVVAVVEHRQLVQFGKYCDQGANDLFPLPQDSVVSQQNLMKQLKKSMNLT